MNEKKKRKKTGIKKGEVKGKGKRERESKKKGAGKREKDREGKKVRRISATQKFYFKKDGD